MEGAKRAARTEREVVQMETEEEKRGGVMTLHKREGGDVASGGCCKFFFFLSFSSSPLAPFLGFRGISVFRRSTDADHDEVDGLHTAL